MSGFDDIPTTLSRLEKRRLYRRRRVVDSPLSRVVTIEGRELLNFCSNDYLGLAAEPRVAAAFKAGVDRWGVGAGASHLVCGHTAAHHQLEEALADFTGRERALLFSTGYGANLGAINALVGSRDHVVEDRLNHASLLDGGWISGARFHWYAHADVQDLESQLQGLGAGAARALVVSDGTFSMDGDRCPVAELATLARRHDAWLMIDDAHGIGVHGEGGRGLVDPAQFDTSDVPVLMATLGKAFGTFGAFIAGDATLIEFLVQRARNYIYTTAIPAAVAVGDLVEVTGEVQEFFGLTEITNASVTVTGIGSVPAAVSFNAAVPSPFPGSPSCGIEYECYESMLVEIANGRRRRAPTRSFGDRSHRRGAHHGRPQRRAPSARPGIEFPGLAGCLRSRPGTATPRSSSSIPDKLGLAQPDHPGRLDFQLPSGVIGFEFGGYELWPRRSERGFEAFAAGAGARRRSPGELHRRLAQSLPALRRRGRSAVDGGRRP